MTTSEPGSRAPLEEVFLSNHEGADVLIELPGGRRVRFEWSCDAPRSTPRSPWTKRRTPKRSAPHLPSMADA